MLEPQIVDQIIDQAFTVLERSGVLIEDPHALERLNKAGLTGGSGDSSSEVSRAQLVQKALKDAPSSLTLHDRDGNPVRVLEGNRVHFVPASSALRVLDRKTQKVRNPNSSDFVEYVKLADGLEEYRLSLHRVYPERRSAGHGRRVAALHGAGSFQAADRLRRLHVVWRSANGTAHGDVPREP